MELCCFSCGACSDCGGCEEIEDCEEMLEEGELSEEAEEEGALSLAGVMVAVDEALLRPNRLEGPRCVSFSSSLVISDGVLDRGQRHQAADILLVNFQDMLEFVEALCLLVLAVADGACW